MPGKAGDKEHENKENVLKYLTNQNRPYSVIDLVNNLHNTIPKSKIEKVLEVLKEEGSIKEKLNGKQKAYVISQDNFPVASDAELDQLDKEANLVQNEINALNAEIKTKNEKLSSFNSQVKRLMHCIFHELCVLIHILFQSNCR